MIPRDPIEELQEKLDQLVDLRKKEEDEYGKLLSLLDQRSNFPLPQEYSKQLSDIKDALNRAWDISINAYTAIQKEDRLFWKEVARSNADYLQPVINQQKEFNSLVVHLINEFTESVMHGMALIREFHGALILYFQRIIPVIDTKYREMVGVEDKNIVTNLLKFQKHIHDAARDHADLLYQELDRRMETLRVDSDEQSKTMDSLHSSVRSLHHLANSLNTIKSEGKALQNTDGHSYYHFEERFRGSREEIKEKFQSYVRYFQNAKKKVVDLGCGRGEFLELLKEASIPAKGVDSNQSMVQKCRDSGLDVTQGDLIEFLVKQKENSLGGLFCSQVAEHLPPSVLIDLLKTAHTRLEPGAPILLETVNIGSMFAFVHVYTKDLTHQTPIHPDTLKFLVTAAGFQKAEIIFTSPVPAVAQLKLFPEPSDEAQHIFNQNMAKLNHLLFAPQEYAVHAVK